MTPLRPTDPIGAADLRIAVLSDAIADRNGVGTYYRDLVDHLSDPLGAVALFCPTGTRDNPYQGIGFPLPGDPTQQLYFPAPYPIADTLRRLRPHIIVIPTPGPYGLYGAQLARRHRCPLIVGYHTMYDALADLYWSRTFGRAVSRFLNRWNILFFRFGKAVVANSIAVAHIARRTTSADVRLMGTPIARDFLQAPMAPESRSLETVLFAGRLAPEKNIEAVLAAAAGLPGVRFAIAGDGPLRQRVVSASARLGNIEYLGWVSRERLRSTIDACDMLVLPSRVEAFGTIALEAMCRRKPVLLSPHCGILNWPDLAAGVFRIEPGESLTQAIRRIRAMTPDTRQRRARTARHAAEALNARTIREWVELFRGIHYRWYATP